jgi:molybdopterin/thiamine biosynthesis adenylyltransferase
MSDSPVFEYESAFSRNFGWVTRAEQQQLRNTRVAIAGLGGVGGFHLLTLARLGIGRFSIADFDTFDLVNFNRQAGAGMQSIGRQKSEVMMDMARDINPEIDFRVFTEGVQAHNIDQFLADVDIYIDGLDFFVFSARQMTFAACRERGIPAVTAAPLGMGTAVLSFLPGSMSFEDYFGFEGCSDDEKALRFLVGLAPAGLHRPYLVEPSSLSLAERRGPSTNMACQICAGAAATEALKILLRRGEVKAAPWGFQFDAYRQRLVHTWRPGGHRNPLQRLLLALGRIALKKQQGADSPDR